MSIINLSKETLLYIISWKLISYKGDNKILTNILSLAISCKQFLYLLNYNYIIRSCDEYDNIYLSTYCLKCIKNKISYGYNEFVRNGIFIRIDPYYDHKAMKYYMKTFRKCITSYINYENGSKIGKYFYVKNYSNRTELFINGQFIGYNKNKTYDIEMQQVNDHIFVEKINKNLYNYLIHDDITSLIITNSNEKLKRYPYYF